MVLTDRKEALLIEEKLQRLVKAAENPLYVNRAYANGGFLPPKMTAEIKHKISLSKTGKKTGKKSDTAKQNISVGLKGKRKSAAHVANMIASRIGKKQKQETVAKRAASNAGKKRTKEQRTNIALAKNNLGPEFSEKMRSIALDRFRNTRVVLRAPTGEIIIGSSLEQLCLQNGLYHTSMMRSLRSGRPLKIGPNKGWQLLELTHAKEQNGSNSTDG